MNRFLAILILTLCVTGTAFAQMPSASIVEEDTLPIEIKLLYSKLLGQVPDYDAIISSNSSFKKPSDSFGQAAIIAQQKSFLQSLYDKSGTNKNIYLSRKISIDAADRKQRIAMVRPINADEPILFVMSPTEQYGVFLHNAALLETLTPPYEFDDFSSLDNIVNYTKQDADVHFTVKPIAADKMDFPLADGTNVHVILGNIVRMKVLSPTDGKLLLDKRFEENEGLPVPQTTTAPSNADHLPLPPATP